MAKFKMGVTPAPQAPITARVGGDAGATPITDKDDFKLVKLAGESRFDLCAAGDPIEGQYVASVGSTATQDGYRIGSIKEYGFINAVCDGSEAAGTGSIAVGDIVVCGTIVAKGTALGNINTTPAPKVRKATQQLSGTRTIANTAFIWRVVSLGDAGAVGDTCVIQRL